MKTRWCYKEKGCRWEYVCESDGDMKNQTEGHGPRLMIPLPAVWCPETGSEALFSLFAELAWMRGFLRVGVTDAVGRVLLTALSIFMKGHNSSGWKKGNLGLRFKTFFLPGRWGLASFIILFTAAVSFPRLSPRSHAFLPQGLCLPQSCAWSPPALPPAL